MKKIFPIMIVAILLFSLTFAAITRYEYYVDTRDQQSPISDTTWTAQTFRVGATGASDSFSIGNISIVVTYTAVGANGTILAFLRPTETTANYPTNGSVNYSTGSYNVSGNTGLVEWTNISMSAYTLQPGVNYSFMFAVQDNDNEGIQGIGSVSTGTYTAGGVFDSSNSGEAWSPKAGWDFLFEIWSQDIIGDTLNVDLDNPTHQEVFSSSTIDFNTTAAPINYNITNVTFFIWYSNSTIFNETINNTLSTNTNLTQLSVNNFTLGSYIWNVETCGKLSVGGTPDICNMSVSNYTFEVGASIDAENYSATAYETDSITFTANVTLIGGANLYAANLIYNGTSYLASTSSLGSDQYQLTRSIDLHQLSTYGDSNVSFYWNFEFLNAVVNSQNSSERNVSVNKLWFAGCNATYPEVVVNYTIWNETDRAEINSSFDGSFDFWLGGGTRRKNHSFSYTDYSHNYTFCSNQNDSLTVSSTLHINREDFHQRVLNLNNETYSTNYTNTSLFLASEGTNIIVQVEDSGFNPIADYFVEIERFYPEIGLYEIVERAKTDIYGQFVARLLEPNTAKYRFTFKDSNNVVKKETGDMTIACRTTICVLPFVIESVEDFSRFGNDSEYNWGFSYDPDDNNFTLTWYDISGQTATWRLFVERYLWNGTTNVCNLTSSSTSGSIGCHVTNMSANYQARVYRRVGSGYEKEIASLSRKVGTEHKTFGVEGLVWSFFLLMTMIVLGYWYPPVGIILYLVGIFALSMTHIIYITPTILVAQLVIGIIFIYAFHKPRS